MSEPQLASTQSVAFPFGSLQREAYLARPEGAGPFPGLVIIHEIYGLNDNIRDIATRFAKEGYLTLAVDLFARHNRALCVLRLFGGMSLRSLDNSGISELKAALSFLAKQPGVDPNKLGAVGFCMGGAFAIAWACTDERLKAIAPFYGMNPRPLSAVARACPVVASYPEKDFTRAQGQKLDAALTRYNIPHEIKTYPGAKHSFFNDTVGNYSADAAADAWQRVLTFFANRLQ